MKEGIDKEESCTAVKISNWRKRERKVDVEPGSDHIRIVGVEEYHFSS